MSSEQGTGSVAAFFDVDGTIVEATVVHYYAYYATLGFSRLRRTLWTAAFLPKVVFYLLLDKFSRSTFNRVFYRSYGGMNASALRDRSEDHFQQVMEPRMYMDALACISEHRSRGVRVVLVTGSLDFIIEPLASSVEADDLIAVHMDDVAGCLSGKLTTEPIGDQEKARIIREYAERNHIDLAASYGYADSSSDMPMLDAVGHATVVNPKPRLRRIAAERGWQIADWK